MLMSSAGALDSLGRIRQASLAGLAGRCEEAQVVY